MTASPGVATSEGIPTDRRPFAPGGLVAALKDMAYLVMDLVERLRIDAIDLAHTVGEASA